MDSSIIQFRDYQHRVVSNTIQAIEEGHKSILIESPTGSGKTIMAHMIAKLLHERFGYRSGWTAMRKHLLRQAREENRHKFNLDCIEYFSTFAEQYPHAPVLFSDEAVHTASETATQVVKAIDPSIHIGLTAFPHRTDRLKLCFSKVIRDAGIRQLIDAGWLCPFHHFTFNAPWTPQEVALIYLRDKERWGKSVIYFLTEAECLECAGYIREGMEIPGRGLVQAKCEVVTGHSNQEAQIQSFDEGDTDVLLNMVVLTEGWDCPKLRTVFTRPGSKGPTIQMTGRTFRRWLEHPELKPWANVVQNNETHWPFTKIASAEKRFLLTELGWEQREGNPRADCAQAQVLQAIASIDVQMPQYIVDKMSKKRRGAHQEVIGHATSAENTDAEGWDE
jgi:superfamily II DNA or RNA helicase